MLLPVLPGDIFDRILYYQVKKFYFFLHIYIKQWECSAKICRNTAIVAYSFAKITGHKPKFNSFLLPAFALTWRSKIKIAHLSAKWINKTSPWHQTRNSNSHKQYQANVLPKLYGIYDACSTLQQETSSAEYCITSKQIWLTCN